MHAQEESAGVL